MSHQNMQKNTTMKIYPDSRPFISNPDLVDRLRSDRPLYEPDQTTFSILPVQRDTPTTLQCRDDTIAAAIKKI